MLELQTKVKGNFKTEATFTTAWLKTLKNQTPRIWSKKFTDWSVWLKPFDCLIASHLDYYACEVKKIDNEVFKYNQIEDHQHTALKRLHLLGRPTIITIWSVKQKDYIIIPFYQLLALGWDTSIIIDFKNKQFIQKK